MFFKRITRIGIAALGALAMMTTACSMFDDSDDSGDDSYYYDYSQNYATITYHANYPAESGKSDTTATQYVYSYGTTTLRANSFACDGYRFLGWAKSADATIALYDDESGVSISEDTALYAVWDKIRDITITFNANDGSDTPATATQKAESVASGDKITLQASGFTRSGYVLLGWSAKRDATEVGYSDYADGGTVYVTRSTGDMALYAVWCSESEPTLIKITFNANDESDSPETVAQYYKPSASSTTTYITLRTNTFARDGYEFIGWAKSAAATKADYSVDGGTYSDITASVTL